jgi:hypothetical protein
MNISKLPDDAIKHIESFVDKRPPFADELLNYDFKQYYWDDDDEIEFDYSDFGLKSFNGSHLNFTFGVEGSGIILYEDILGYKRINWNEWVNEPCFQVAGYYEWDILNVSTLARLLKDDE